MTLFFAGYMTGGLTIVVIVGVLEVIDSWRSRDDS